MGQLYHRYLDKDKCSALEINFQNYDRNMIISEKSRHEIMWWIRNIKEHNVKIIRNAPHIYFEIDASSNGWGAVFHTR